MTMPARRESTFCARRRTQCPEVFLSQADFFRNSWDDRTWPCQNVNLKNTGSDIDDDDDGGDDDEPTTTTPHSQQANMRRDQISRSDDTPSL